MSHKKETKYFVCKLKLLHVTFRFSNILSQNTEVEDESEKVEEKLPTLEQDIQEVDKEVDPDGEGVDGEAADGKCFLKFSYLNICVSRSLLHASF